MDPEGFTIEAVKAPVWHGLPNIGLRIKTENETLVFSSDTVHNKGLWKLLYNQKRVQNLNMSKKEFEGASIIYGDINDYIERTWSEERYGEALNSFNDAVVIHDISVRESIVHTSYNVLLNTVLDSNLTILTHSPDKITSEWVLSNMGKRFRIMRGKYYEIVGDKFYLMNADIYHKENGRYYVGYRNENGKYLVYEKEGMLYLSTEEIPGGLYRVDLYEDISGKYFPKIEDENQVYRERKDGKVEIVVSAEYGSYGKIVEDCRTRLAKKRNGKLVSNAEAFR